MAGEIAPVASILTTELYGLVAEHGRFSSAHRAPIKQIPLGSGMGLSLLGRRDIFCAKVNDCRH